MHTAGARPSLRARPGTNPRRKLSRKRQKISWGEVVPIKSFRCPLSRRLLHDPIISPEGVSYDQEAYLESSQVNGQREVPQALPTNHAVKAAIDEYIQRTRENLPELKEGPLLESLAAKDEYIRTLESRTRQLESKLERVQDGLSVVARQKENLNTLRDKFDDLAPDSGAAASLQLLLFLSSTKCSQESKDEELLPRPIRWLSSLAGSSNGVIQLLHCETICT